MYGSKERVFSNFNLERIIFFLYTVTTIQSSDSLSLCPSIRTQYVKEVVWLSYKKKQLFLLLLEEKLVYMKFYVNG